jgi:hypothetical protein
MNAEKLVYCILRADIKALGGVLVDNVPVCTHVIVDDKVVLLSLSLFSIIHAI